MWEWIVEPWRYGFMRQALAATLIVGATCSLLGVYVVLRRMAFVGAAIAHTTLPGLAIAYLNRWNLLAGALVAALATAVGIGWLSRGRRLREDAAIGVAFSGMFALGVALTSRMKSQRDFAHLLFGNVLAVTTADLIGLAAAGALTCGALWLFHKEWMLTTIDPLHAQTIGLSPEWMRQLLLVLLALAVVSGIQAVGVVLTTSLMVTPAASAALITRRLPWMFAWSAAFAGAGGVVGLYASYYLSISAGAAIVLACTLLFGLASLAARWRQRNTLPAGPAGCGP